MLEIDIGDELARLVCRAIVRVMFADRFTTDQALRITAAQDTIATAVLPRLLLPFVPNAVPLPRDRAFRQAVRTIDDIVLPVVRQARAEGRTTMQDDRSPWPDTGMTASRSAASCQRVKSSNGRFCWKARTTQSR